MRCTVEYSSIVHRMVPYGTVSGEVSGDSIDVSSVILTLYTVSQLIYEFSAFA